jgi:hypothetical protein
MRRREQVEQPEIREIPSEISGSVVLDEGGEGRTRSIGVQSVSIFDLRRVQAPMPHKQNAEERTGIL